MKAFLMDAYEFLSVLLPFLLVSLLLRKKHKLGRGITAVPHGWTMLSNHRRTDVDDLILNTAGALLGFLLYRGFVRVTKWRGLPYGASRWEPVLYTGAMFAGHFLLFYELGIARLLYHF